MLEELLGIVTSGGSSEAVSHVPLQPRTKERIPTATRQPPAPGRRAPPDVR